MGQCLAEDIRLPFRARTDANSRVARRQHGDRGRALDLDRLSRGRRVVSAPRPRHAGVCKKWRWLALRAFPHVAQSRRAAGELCEPAGEGVVRLNQAAAVSSLRGAVATKQSSLFSWRAFWIASLRSQ